jgi:hypothetical protein
LCSFSLPPDYRSLSITHRVQHALLSAARSLDARWQAKAWQRRA